MPGDEDEAEDPSARSESGGAFRDVLLVASGLLVGVLLALYLADPDGDAAQLGADDADADAESDDAELEERVLEAFANDPILSERAIEIGSLPEGVITLDGRVHSRREVTYASTIAGGTPGVAGVVSRLLVRADEQDDIPDGDEARGAGAPAAE
jgi:hypothetical protein